MSRNSFSKELEEFVRENIDSVKQMEVLFLLCREKSCSWTAQEVATQLYAQPESVADWLADLKDRRFCVVVDPSGPRYQYQPENNAKDRLTQELMEAYRARHVAVITLIFSKPASHLQLFLDAFKFRKDS